MPIVVNLDVMLARRKMTTERERVNITIANLISKAKAILNIRRNMQSAGMSAR